MTVRHLLVVVFIRVLKGIATIFGRKVYWAFMSSLIENLECRYQVAVGDKNCNFIINSRLSHFRAATLLTKEPETIRWIEEFPSNAVLLDIGANIGVYTVYAARMKGVRVIAVEPSPSNYSTLIENLTANDIEDRVFAICAAADKETRFAALHQHYGGTVYGGSGVIFDSSQISDDEEIDEINQIFALGITIDELLAIPGLPFPTHMKLDIIGTQEQALEGARKLLADSRLVGAMIEMPRVGEGSHQKCMKIVRECGLTINSEFESANPIEQFFLRA